MVLYREIRLLHDADVYAAIEAGVRALADELETSAALPVVLRVEATSEARAFVLEHFHLIPFINEAADALKARFPDDQVCLDFFADPEEGHDQVFLVVRTTRDFEDVTEAFSRFEQELWFALSARAGSRLGATVRFV